MNPELLLLADSRLPSGGHGHSGGVEALAGQGLLRTTADLALFLDGRLRTGGATVAAAAAAACALAGRGPGRPQQGGFTAVPPEHGHPAVETHRLDWAPWDAALDARTPSAALRVASRAQGAALARTVAAAWPGPALDALRALGRPHHPLVLGVAVAGAGAAPAEAAALALHHLVGGACSAAVRLLGLDPLAVAAVAAGTSGTARRVAADAVRCAAAAVAVDDPAVLPADGSPLHDVLARLHSSTEVTLFAS